MAKTERSERMTEIATQHGHASSGRRTPTYQSWSSMMGRCYVKTSGSYHRYGAKGVTVCERWRVFENFLADMGERPSKAHSIDRKDNSKGYELDNCRWATRAEQNRNQARARMLEYDGAVVCATDLAARFGIKRGTLTSRIDRGMSVGDALRGPVRHRRAS
jgi:hypothetical protein